VAALDNLGGEPMPKSRAAELRRKARLCRRATAVPIQGAAGIDRLLLEIAEQLEREAEALENSHKHADRPVPAHRKKN